MRHTTIAIATSWLCRAMTILALGVCSTAAIGQTDGIDDSLDRALLNAVRAESLSRVSDLLERGADPNRVLGPGRDDWAMCAAALRGNASIVRMLIEFGGDPNVANLDGGRTSEYPIVCAMLPFSNESFDVLIEAGADTNVTSCQKCEEKFQYSLFVVSLQMSNFTSARKLFEIQKPPEGDFEDIAFILGMTGTMPGHREEPFMIELHEFLADHGVYPTPRYPTK